MLLPKGLAVSRMNYADYLMFAVVNVLVSAIAQNLAHLNVFVLKPLAHVLAPPGAQST